MKFNEVKFKQQAKKHLLRCRPGDWNHAQRVVAWVKKLGYQSPQLNQLIMAAYIHDIGWRDVLPNRQKITKQQLQQLEPVANANSQVFVEEFLSEFQLTKPAIKQIQAYIRAADLHKSSTPQEAIIVDADNLSKLNLDHLKEKYRPSSWLDWHQKWSNTFPQRIQTHTGKQIYPDLLDKLKDSIEQELSQT